MEKLLPAASATADPTMAPIALLATAEVICQDKDCIRFIFAISLSNKRKKNP